tara:strand:+ start:232 stop:510 length:279 start_codon:yes stop_codon:yes gene_type:complete
MNKIILKDQTKLVNKLIDIEEIEYDEIENYDGDIYSWLLIDNNYKDIFVDLNYTYIEYEGNFWIGKTFYGTSWKHSGLWKNLVEKLPFLENK